MAEVHVKKEKASQASNLVRYSSIIICHVWAPTIQQFRLFQMYLHHHDMQDCIHCLVYCWMPFASFKYHSIYSVSRRTTWLIKCIKFYTCLNYWEAGPSDQKFHIAQVALVRASIGLTADLATSAWFPTWLKWVANSCMVIRRGDVHLRWLALHVYNK